jgi:2-phosphoglycerate kinase
MANGRLAGSPLMAGAPHAILIGGASHTGKSTLAAKLAAATGYPVVSTDSLARHPGRPWPDPPAFIADYYANLTTDTHMTLLLHHHENLWPTIQRLISETPQIIIEGNALRPEYLTHCDPATTTCLCLTAPDATLTTRINQSADTPLAQAFLRRTLTDNAQIIASAETHAIRCEPADKITLSSLTSVGSF